MSPGKVAGPAVFVNRYGKGKTILVPAVSGCGLYPALSNAGASRT